MSAPLSVVVVGAGVAGAACARVLLDAGHVVTVFDKGRGFGGRCSTRSTDDGRRFDHGAQYFTATDARFVRVVEGWRDEGIVTRWQPRILSSSSSSSSLSSSLLSSSSRAHQDKWVAQPGMASLLRRMLSGVSVDFSETVVSIDVDRSAPQRFICTNSDGRVLGVFDAVVVAVPAPQAAPLLETIAPALATQARTAQMRATWAVLLDYDGVGPEVDFDAAELRDRPLRWAAREASKPGRLPGARWVLHGTASEVVDAVDAAAHTSPSTADLPARAIELLLADFVAVVGDTAARPSFSQAHLWRYAFVEKAVGSDCLISADGRVVACGDWCIGPRVEAAFLSGTAAAQRVLSRP